LMKNVENSLQLANVIEQIIKSGWHSLLNL
jgi:hypothetical protein